MAASSKRASRRHAVLIAASRFTDPRLSTLITPPSDVHGLAEVLRDPEIGGFETVRLLLDQSVQTLRTALAELVCDRGTDDSLLVYYSGHGLLDMDGNLFLASRDTELGGRLSATALRAADVTREMATSRARRQVLILDCCYSGALGRALGAKGSATEHTQVTRWHFGDVGCGRATITASSSTQLAWEGEPGERAGEHRSVFTRHLVEGLKNGEADGDGDGLITIDEWYDYVYEKVSQSHPHQRPQRWIDQQEGNFVIAQNPLADIKEIALPSDLARAIASGDAISRHGAVTALEALLGGRNRGHCLAARSALTKLVQDDSRQVSAAAELALQRSIAVAVARSRPRTEAPAAVSTPPVAVTIPPVVKGGRALSWLAASIAIVAALIAGGAALTKRPTTTAQARPRIETAREPPVAASPPIDRTASAKLAVSAPPEIAPVVEPAAQPLAVKPQGDAEAPTPADLYRQALRLLRADKLTPAIEKLSDACKRNHVASCKKLSQHAKEVRAGRDKLYQLACDHGAALGCYNLGWLYQSGEGVRADPKRACELYDASCSKGYAYACAMLAGAYHDGRLGLTKDVGRARELLRRACALGDCEYLHKFFPDER